ncbi:MAG: AsmA-like C-terminal region-containing protein [Alistipes sp.]
MQLFGGSATASGSYSTAADPQRPALKLSAGTFGRFVLQDVRRVEMVQKLVPLFAKTGGDYSLSLDMTTALDPKMEPDLQSLSATGEIKSANIRIQNLEAFDALAKALDNDKLRKIEAKDVAVRFSIRDGRVTTQPFDLKMGDIKINMSGSTGLDRTIDYTAKVALPAGSAGGILESVNVGIGGTFTSPKITLGVKEAAEQAVKNVIDQQIQKLTGSESLGEEIQKQADNLRKEAKRAGDKAGRSRRSAAHETCGRRQGEGCFGEAGGRESGRQRLVEEAKKQADKLSAEAERQIEKLTAKQE